MLVEPGAFVPQIVGADDRRIAPRVAEANRSLFQHRDIADAVLLGEVVGGREAMPAAADDHDTIARLRRRLAPERLPAAVAAERLASQRRERIALHRAQVSRGQPTPSAAA